MSAMDGLKAFCDDLASDAPSPGGGTASAAAGAMAASLLSMVCGITLKSKKHEPDWGRLSSLRRRADEMSSQLLECAELDASTYLLVVSSARSKRESPEDMKAAAEYDEAVRKATEVPARTAELCVAVLRLAEEVSMIGTKSAASDVEVARLLAAAGVDGAVANVRINLPYCADEEFRSRAKERADRLSLDKAGLLSQ